MIKIINYTEEILKKVTIDEGITAIEQFLIQVYFDNPVSNKVLARKLCLPIPLITAIKKEFIKAGLMRQDRGITMTELGYRYVEEELGYRGLDKELYGLLHEDNYQLEDVFSEELILMERVFRERPTVDLSVDQTHCTYMTSLKRSLLALEYDSLIHKKILCVGDDDLVSVSLGFLLRKLYKGQHRGKTEIHVVDVDERYLTYIEDIAKSYNLPIRCHAMNLRNPMDRKLIGKFDCFYTDPPYTISGMRLFLSRGITGLKSIKGLPIFFSFAHKSYDYSYDMMRKLYEMGLSISGIMPRFNTYEGASIIGNIGQAMILNTTSYTQPDIKEDETFVDCLYTREVRCYEREKAKQ